MFVARDPDWCLRSDERSRPAKEILWRGRKLPRHNPRADLVWRFQL